MFKWYLIIINALGLLFMIADKQRAKKKRWRYSEPFLLTIAALGGSIGTLLGMFLFHHKTRKPKFSIGVPILLIIQLILILLYLYTTK